MKKHFCLLPIFVFVLIFSPANRIHAQLFVGNTEIDTTSIVTGLDTPWEILWGPDNHIWVTERSGKISRLNPETGVLQHIFTISDVHEEGEAGLLGMALHPDFPDPAYVYLVYNYYDDAIKERIVHYTYNGTGLIDPVILLEDIGGAGNHNGSRLIIDNNYKLFISTGDAANTSTAQNLASLSGKILRMNLDGSIPSDNPFAESYVWSWGHRNPQGLVIAPDGKIYSSEHGPNNDDELNLIVKESNYGWPDVHGYCDLTSELDFCENNNVVEPLQAWTPTLAVAGIDYYNSDKIPEWQNSVLMTCLKESKLMGLKLSIDGTEIESSQEWFYYWFGRLRDICISPGGRVYIATSNLDGRGSPVPGDDRIVQIKAHNDNENPSNLPTEDKRPVISPNPMHENALIYVGGGQENVKLKVYNLSSKLVVEENITGEKYILQRNNLPSGVYIVKIASTKSTNIQKLIIQ